MEEIKPTWLYIKQHNVTKLKYFGKTERDNLDKYKGSGLYWSRHLKKYGNDTTTIWKMLFTDRDKLIQYATEFSTKNNIVESTEWANLKNENGLDGGNDPGHLLGRKFAEEHRKKLSEARYRRPPISDDTRKLMSIAASKPKSDKWKLSASSNRKGKSAPNLGKSHSVESRQKISEAVLGEKNPMYGRSHTEESRKRMSEARVGKSPSNKGVPLSEEQKLKQSEKMKGKTPWNKGVLMKQVLCKGCGKITTIAALGRYHKNC